MGSSFPTKKLQFGCPFYSSWELTDEPGRRHLLSGIVAPVPRRVGNDRDVADVGAIPSFFRHMSEWSLRMMGFFSVRSGD
ncbi:hypothetical protein I6F26_26505 [Ensifer sp. IC3342]|nr:hypothetical protein [Ensifer sp. BRP08]MCA1450112.1 hypothetical protein [Ensifer sp. IC3342]